MKSQIFTYGGGAGIGSYVIVIKDGQIQNPNAEKIRWAYDSGENLFLSIIDDTTEEALLPLSGYVGLDGNLHLSGRDFDDNKTYEFTIENENQSVEMAEVDGITIGEGTIPTEGGGGGDSRPVLRTDFKIALSYDIENPRPLPDLAFIDATGGRYPGIPSEFTDAEGWGNCIVHNTVSTDELASYHYTNDGQEIYIELVGLTFSLQYYISTSTGLYDSTRSEYELRTPASKICSISLLYGDEFTCDIQGPAQLLTREDYRLYLNSLAAIVKIPTFIGIEKNGILVDGIMDSLNIPESSKDPITFNLITCYGYIHIAIYEEPAEEGDPTFNFEVDWTEFYSPAGGGSSGDSIPVLSDYYWMMHGYTAQLFGQDRPVTSIDDFPDEFNSPAGCYVGVGFGTSGKLYRCIRIKPGYYALTREDDSIIIRCKVDDESDNLTCYAYFCTEEEFFNYNPNFVVLSACTAQGNGDMVYEKVYLSRDSLIQSLDLHAFANGGNQPIIDQDGNSVHVTSVSSRYIVLNGGFGQGATVIALQTDHGR